MLHKWLVLVVTLLLPLAVLAEPPPHLITKQSAFDVTETLDRLEKILQEKGITVMQRINHTQNAEGVGMELQPVQLLIFGNPKQGTVLMQANPAIGIALPMKALAWEDDNGQTWLAYPSIEVLVRNYGIDPNLEIAKKMSAGLNNLTDAAVKP